MGVRRKHRRAERFRRLFKEAKTPESPHLLGSSLLSPSFTTRLECNLDHFHSQLTSLMEKSRCAPGRLTLITLQMAVCPENAYAEAPTPASLPVENAHRKLFPPIGPNASRISPQR